MDNGFIKLYRQIQDWEWYTDSATVHFFIHCLFCANWKPKNWKGQEIKRGQFVSSYANLSAQTGLSVKQVRTRIDRLVGTGELKVETTNRFTMITVCKYDTYQSKYSEEGNQKANESQSKGKQKADKGQQLKKDKKVKKDKNTIFDQKIADVLSDIDSISDKNILLALHIWKDVDSLQPNNKTTQRAKVNNWSEPIRLMVEQDERTHKEIWNLWKRVQKDEFWRGNILSTSKLRDQYDRLNIKLNKPKNNHDELISKLFR